MSQKRRQLLNFLAGLLAVTAFVAVSSIAVVWSHGLRFNPDTKRFEATAVIAVESSDDLFGLEVLVNGEVVGTKLPFQLRNLVPGYYEVIIQKPNFYSWRQVFQLEPGEVEIIENIQLIAKTPKTTLITEEVSFTEPLFEVGLSHTDSGELLDRGKLISSFATTIKLARRIEKAYIYQIEDELRIKFPEGRQDYLIQKLAGSDPVPMLVDQSDWEIIIDNQGQIMRIELTVDGSEA